MLTEQFKAVQEAEATWKSDEMDLPKLHAYEDAERAYRTEVSKWRQWWNNIPDNEEKVLQRRTPKTPKTRMSMNFTGCRPPCVLTQ